MPSVQQQYNSAFPTQGSAGFFLKKKNPPDLLKLSSPFPQMSIINPPGQVALQSPVNFLEIVYFVP